eukprot:scaffold4623_cov104-Isochrysis_galbana.AAC.6
MVRSTRCVTRAGSPPILASRIVTLSWSIESRRSAGSAGAAIRANFTVDEAVLSTWPAPSASEPPAANVSLDVSAAAKLTPKTAIARRTRSAEVRPSPMHSHLRSIRVRLASCPSMRKSAMMRMRHGCIHSSAPLPFPFPSS